MLGLTSIWHWVIVLLIVILVFGAGRIPRVMGDMAKGIKAFKSGMKDEATDSAAAKQVTSDSGDTASSEDKDKSVA